MSVAGQRPGQLPLKRVTTIRSPLLGNMSVKTPGKQQRISIAGRRKHIFRGYGVLNVFSVRCPCRRFIGENEGHLKSVVEQEVERREALAVREEGLG
jgi:hypothetical protein